MKKLQFFGMNYLLLRSERCQMQCKFNRAAKIALSAKELVNKFDKFISTQTITDRSQCALAIKLMLFTGIRVGNEDSANGYMTKPHPNQKDAVSEFRQTFGLTTLLKKHVRITSGKVILSFTGKKGVSQKIVVTDKKLVMQCKHQLRNAEGDMFLSVNDTEVRKFVKKSVGQAFLVKDFRTMFANTVATEQILKVQRKERLLRKKDLRAEQKIICENVAMKLGNTPGISKRAYIDPELLEFHEVIRMKS